MRSNKSKAERYNLNKRRKENAALKNKQILNEDGIIKIKKKAP